MGPIKTQDSVFRDYWLVDEGILEIKIVSLMRLIVLTVPLTAVLGAASLLFHPLEGYFEATALVWDSFVLSLYYRRARRIRNKLSDTAIASIATNKDLSTLHLWADILDMQFAGQNMGFRTKNRSHRAVVGPADLERTKELARSKLGSLVTEISRFR